MEGGGKKGQNLQNLYFAHKTIYLVVWDTPDGFNIGWEFLRKCPSYPKLWYFGGFSSEMGPKKEVKIWSKWLKSSIFAILAKNSPF